MSPPPKESRDGVLLTDKPSGCTSFDVVKKIRRRLRLRKVGHTGTLDPMATGLLPLCLGEATKIIRLLAGETKRYRAVLRLGRSTDTLDREGRETNRTPVPDLEESRIRHCLNSFLGEIDQVPPMYSALHHQGRRMHELAREGLEVERKPRRVRIHAIDLTRYGPDWIELDVACGSGTYIRSLVADVAVRLGTVGYLDELRRTETSGWSLSSAMTLDKMLRLEPLQLRRRIVPLDRVLARFPRVDVDAGLGQRLTQGQQLPATELASLGLKEPSAPVNLWFRSPGGSVIVLAELRGAPLRMKILRVLHPET